MHNNTKFSQIFDYYKLTRSQRSNALEPRNLSVWTKHIISEFLGTILISLFLAGVSMIAGKKGDIAAYMINPLIIGLYAGFIAVGICLVIFVRWSCDLNPAVTIYRMINGTNTFKYGMYKIIVQFMGGVIGGLVVYGVGYAIRNNIVGNIETKNGIESWVNNAIDAFKSAKLLLGPTSSENIYIGAIVIFVSEVVGTTLLIFSIFSQSINPKFRFVMILFIISAAVWVCMWMGSAALNPARGLAQQLPGLIWGVSAGNNYSAASLNAGTIAMLLGTLFAPWFYAFIQGLTTYFFSPWLSKIIEYKNNNDVNLQPRNSNNKN